MNEIITTEIARHENTYQIIDAYKKDRETQILIFDNEKDRLLAERLDTSNWNEKKDLTEKLDAHAPHDPRKRLPVFEQVESPYFGIVGIHDNDKKIGCKEYIIGKQTLFNGVKVAIIDWRRKDISEFFYTYTDGEEYETEIAGIEREGTVTHVRKIGIAKRNLLSIEAGGDTFTFKNNAWSAKDSTAQAAPVSAEIKTDTGNHQLIDIVALISPDQFKEITKQFTGCTYLTGGAGSGKTTIALHRLSYLQFNEPKYFDPAKCLVLVFNRTLKDYVKATSTELLGATAIDTFTSWGISALKAFGCKGISFTADLNGFDEIKKHAAIEFLLNMYVNSGNTIESFYDDLMDFYHSDFFISYFFKDDPNSSRMLKFMQHHVKTDNKLAYADVGILLRLCQLRNKSKEVKSAFNYYDHIVADEAQDFAQHELEAIFAALNEHKSLTICADEKQKILSFVDANGLSNFKSELHTIGLDKTTFTVGYRSAPEIMKIANIVAGKEEGKLPAYGHSEVVSILKATEQDNRKLDALHEVVTKICEYQKTDPTSLTAVICKNKSDCTYIYDEINRIINHGIISLHPVSTITFTPGVIITNAHQVKGLEFTNVILWNPSYKTYKSNDEDKNLLYVAISRACKRLAIIHYEKLSTWFKS